MDVSVEPRVIELKLPPGQYEQLATVAHARQISAVELAQMAVCEWLEEQTKLERARTLMRELGWGLGQGQSARDVARDHDLYLYPKQQA